MGTRGAFGVVVGEQAKIGYNQFDSYPDGKGLANLQWLRRINTHRSEWRDHVVKFRKLAEDCRLVDDTVKPTPEDIERLRGYTDLYVSEQSTDDWYCLTRDTHGSIEMMLRCGYIQDWSKFPLDSLFCEWGYIVDFDNEVFEVYSGFQKTLPKRGRWRGRPTKAEDALFYEQHLAWCKENKREPWRGERSEYKAIELAASWPFNALPGDDEFVVHFRLLEARSQLKPSYVRKYPEEVMTLINTIIEEGYAMRGRPHADEWAEIVEEARAKLGSPALAGSER